MPTRYLVEYWKLYNGLWNEEMAARLERVLRACIKHAEAPVKAARQQLVHGHITAVKARAAHAALHVRHPSLRARSQVKQSALTLTISSEHSCKYCAVCVSVPFSRTLEVQGEEMFDIF